MPFVELFLRCFYGEFLRFKTFFERAKLIFFSGELFTVGEKGVSFRFKICLFFFKRIFQRFPFFAGGFVFLALFGESGFLFFYRRFPGF